MGAIATPYSGIGSLKYCELSLTLRRPISHRSDHVGRSPLPVLLQPAAALHEMGLLQQARILLLHRHRSCRPRHVGYRTADSEILGRGAHPEDSHDIPSAKGTTAEANWIRRRVENGGRGSGGYPSVLLEERMGYQRRERERARDAGNWYF